MNLIHNIDSRHRRELHRGTVNCNIQFMNFIHILSDQDCFFQIDCNHDHIKITVSPLHGLVASADD